MAKGEKDSFPELFRPDSDNSLQEKSEGHEKQLEASLFKNLQMFDNMISTLNIRLKDLSDMLSETQKSDMSK